MPVQHEVITVDTQGNNDVIDLTQALSDFVARSSVRDGLVSVWCAHTTAAVTAVELEDGANRDLAELLERLAPEESPYHHNQHDSNGHAHARSAIVGPCVMVPIADNRLAIGRWQSVVMVDFDDRPRTRTVRFTLLS